jgi:hypothetical protein
MILHAVILRIVGQAGLGHFHGTDAAEKIGIHLFGGILQIQTVGGLAGDIVDGVGQDNIIVFPVVKVFDDLVKEAAYQGFILQSGVAQLIQKFLGTSLHFLLQREFHIQKILSQGSPQSSFENIKIFEFFLLRQGEKGFSGLKFLILFMVHIAAADPGGGAVVGGKMAADLRNLFFIHGITLPVHNFAYRGLYNIFRRQSSRYGEGGPFGLQNPGK